MKKIIVNSVLSILAGLIISVGACYLGTVGEIVNYAGAMCIFGGFVFIDQWMLRKLFSQNNKWALVRLPVYLLLAVVLILVPLKTDVAEEVMRCLRSAGIAFLLLALWRFFTFTTVEGEKIHKD